MAEVFMFADETGNLDYNVSGGGSKYFGIGTATWQGEHGDSLWKATQLRFQHAKHGIELPSGYHAKDDSHTTRAEVYELIREQAPRFDATFLNKARAYDSVKDKGENYLYRMAWFLHFKEIAKRIIRRGDTLHVAVATLGTKARKRAFQEAIKEVCRDHAPGWCEHVGHRSNPGFGVHALGSGMSVAGYPALAGRGPLDLLLPATLSTHDDCHHVKPAIAHEIDSFN